MKRRIELLIVLGTVLVLGIVASCDLLSPNWRGFPTVRTSDDSEVGYGQTLYREVNIADIPYTENLRLTFASGQGPISIRGIGDITDRDDPSWHKGNMAIDHAGEGGTFELKEEVPFTITLADVQYVPPVAAGTYEMEVGIQNNNGIMPNPYIFRYRVLVK